MLGLIIQVFGLVIVMWLINRARWGRARAAVGAATYCQRSLWVCLGWKNSQFNSILSLPGSTHQDTTKNEMLNNLSNLKTKYIISPNALNKKKSQNIEKILL